MAISNTNNLSLALSLNILRALGGDMTVKYETVDEVWVAINEIYERTGDRIDIEALILDITENGQYRFDPNENIDAWAPVHLNVEIPQKYTDEQVQQLVDDANTRGYNEGFIAGTDDGYHDGYAEGLDDGREDQKALLESVTFEENGVYEKEDGWNSVTVEVPQKYTDDDIAAIKDAVYAEGERDGMDLQKAKLVPLNVTQNGYYKREDGYSDITVEVAGGGGGTAKEKIYNGFSFNGGNTVTGDKIRDIDFSQYDWSSVYEMNEFFSGFKASNDSEAFSSDVFENFREYYNGKMLSCYDIFKSQSAASSPIKEIPDLGGCVSDCVIMNRMFANSGLTNLDYIDNYIDSSNCISMGGMFENCTNLTSAEGISDLITDNVINMSYMFNGCSKLTKIPYINTSSVMDMSYMFYNCSELTDASALAEWDFSNVVNIYYLFLNNNKLNSIPDLNLSNVPIKCSVNNNFIKNCNNLTSIGVIDMDSAVDVNYMFGSSALTKLTDLGGFRNLGKMKYIASTGGNAFLNNFPNLTIDSLLNVFNLLYDRTEPGYTTVKLKLHPNHLALLTEDDIAIATNKNWIIS